MEELEQILNEHRANEDAYVAWLDEEADRQNAVGEWFRANGKSAPAPTKEEAEALHHQENRHHEADQD